MDDGAGIGREDSDVVEGFDPAAGMHHQQRE
jgi:hypothetical protein